MAGKTKKGESPVAKSKVPSVPPIVEEVLGAGTFSVEKFVECFDVLVEAVGGIGHLRRVVLSLAIQGSLVGRSESAESASALRQRAMRRLAQHTIAKPDCAELAGPYVLPKGWCWARFTDLGVFGRGKSKHRPRNDPKLFQDGKYPLVQTGDIARANGTVETHSALFGEFGLAQSRLWPKGTLCITIAANIADTALLGFDACFPDSVVGFVPDEDIGDARYFEYFIRTAKERIEQFAPATAQKNINLEILSDVLIPLPPVTEMRHIVARVNQLMALIDEVETNQTRRRALGARFTQASLEALTTAESPEEFDVAWKRVVDHLALVIDSPVKVKVLRRTLVDLAITGKLSRQAQGGWPAMTLDDVVSSTKYGTAKPCTLDAKHLTPVLRIPNVVQGALDLTELKYAEFTDSELAELRLVVGDVLVVRSNGSKELVGRASVVDGRAAGMAYAGYLIRLRVDCRKVTPEWLKLTLEGSELRIQVEKPLRTTSGVHNINTKELLALRICVPSIPEQEVARSQLKPLLSFCDELEARLSVAEDRASKLVEAVVQELVA